MKKLLCVLLCAVFVLGLMPALAADVSEVMMVTKCNDYVSLRKEPDTKSERLAKVHLGELVSDCYSASNGFVKCSWGGKTGYILEQYLKTTPFTLSDGILPNQQVVKCEEYVSLREHPDTQSKRLIKVPLGEYVTGCVSYMGNWVYCEYKGHRGYVLTKYLKKADYNSPKPTPKPTATPKPKTYPALPYYMQVVDVNEYVSLRATPSSTAAVLKKVPLGEVVEGCVQVSDTYVSCEYDGSYGYVLLKYLAEYEPPAVVSAFDDLDMPSYALFNSRGTPVLEYSFNGYTVVVRRAYTENSEEIMAVCYDPTMKAIWCVPDQVDYPTELTLTSAFVAGSADRPLLVMFVSGKGFTAYGIGPWTDELWKNADSTKLGGGLTTAVGRDGAIYAIGFYNSSMLCVSKEGVTLWQTDHYNSNVYWPYYIELDQDRIYVYYDSDTGVTGKVYRDSYDYDGKYIVTEVVPAPVLPDSEQGSEGGIGGWDGEAYE